MIEFEIIEGSSRNSTVALHRFPATIGRSSTTDLCLEAAGVWDRHLEINLDPKQGFLLRTCDGALTSINGQHCPAMRLRNGDLIEIGGVKLRFWLRAATQRGFRAREVATWLALGLLVAGQIALICLLPS